MSPNGCICTLTPRPRVARAAPVNPFLSDYKRVWEMDQAKDAYWAPKEWTVLKVPSGAMR